MVLVLFGKDNLHAIAAGATARLYWTGGCTLRTSGNHREEARL